MHVDKMFRRFSILVLYVTVCQSQLVSEKIAKHRNWKYLPTNNCGLAAAMDRIIGGKAASLGQYPWLARLGYSGSRRRLSFLCAGAIISRWYVLTANHCLLGVLGETLQIVRLGENFLDRDKDCQNGVCAPRVDDIPVRNAVRFHNGRFLSENYGDIALMKLARPAKFNDFVYPICLPTMPIIRQITEHLKTGTIVEVAGWGTTSPESQAIPDKLMYLRMPVVSLDNCKQTYPQNRIDISQICIGMGDGRDTCVGDSGGPIMKAISLNSTPRFYMFGLVSYGVKWCGIKEAVYTNVTHYMQWILDNMESVA